MTEHELQRVLTRTWSDVGVVIDGERSMLVAWEVMPEVWGINDASGYWASVSIDFLAIDKDGRVAAIEVKPGKLRGTKTAWGALCQVTHRAILIARNATLDDIAHVHDVCGAGADGRAPQRRWPRFAERHATFFGRTEPINSLGRGVRRVIVAESADPSFFDVLDEFNRLPVAMVLEQLRSRYSGTSGFAAREFQRLASVLPVATDELQRAVSFNACDDLTTEGSTLEN